MRIFTASIENPKKYELRVNLAGDQNFIDFLSTLKNGSFIVVDPDLDEYTRSFYIRKADWDKPFILAPGDEGYTGREKGFQLVVQGPAITIETLAKFIAYVGVAGNGGHSYEIKTSEGDSIGWDGDGRDIVMDIYLYGKKMSVNDFYTFNTESFLEYTFDKAREKADPLP